MRSLAFVLPSSGASDETDRCDFGLYVLPSFGGRGLWASPAVRCSVGRYPTCACTRVRACVMSQSGAFDYAGSSVLGACDLPSLLFWNFQVSVCSMSTSGSSDMVGFSALDSTFLPTLRVGRIQASPDFFDSVESWPDFVCSSLARRLRSKRAFESLLACVDTSSGVSDRTIRWVTKVIALPSLRD